jgi:hypothetical protein
MSMAPDGWRDDFLQSQQSKASDQMDTHKAAATVASEGDAQNRLVPQIVLPQTSKASELLGILQSHRSAVEECGETWESAPVESSADASQGRQMDLSADVAPVESPADASGFTGIRPGASDPSLQQEVLVMQCNSLETAPGVAFEGLAPHGGFSDPALQQEVLAPMDKCLWRRIDTPTEPEASPQPSPRPPSLPGSMELLPVKEDVDDLDVTFFPRPRLSAQTLAAMISQENKEHLHQKDISQRKSTNSHVELDDWERDFLWRVAVEADQNPLAWQADWARDTESESEFLRRDRLEKLRETYGLGLLSGDRGPERGESYPHHGSGKLFTLRALTPTTRSANSVSNAASEPEPEPKQSWSSVGAAAMWAIGVDVNEL